jgi:hypothetical protein
MGSEVSCPSQLKAHLYFVQSLQALMLKLLARLYEIKWMFSTKEKRHFYFNVASLVNLANFWVSFKVI